jgi:hypothetical protein
MRGEPQWINRKMRTDDYPSLQFRRPRNCFRIGADDGRRFCGYLSSELQQRQFRACEQLNIEITVLENVNNFG